MAYTEIKKINGKSYYYRVKSIRNREKISKKRIYLGKDLGKDDLLKKESDADKKLNDSRRKYIIPGIKSKIIKILKKNNVKKAGIFGSYARGEHKKSSDIDILIEPPKGIGLGFVNISIELEKKLGKKIHLVSYKFINPHIKEQILKEEVRII